MTAEGGEEQASERTDVRERASGRASERMARQGGDKGVPERAARGRTARRFRATVEYDGTEFSGFQIQVGARTVQGELEAALARLTGGTRQPVQGAGRTDAGVHATGQVIAFTYPGDLPVEDLTDALNGTLPPDVAVRDLRPVPAGYNPRYAARYREYRYSIWNGPRSPLRERTTLWVRQGLDVAAMAEAASAFEGRHDFSAFGGADPQPVRTVHRLRVRKRGSAVEIDVQADAFLRGMVRRIVATLLAVGKGQLEPAAVPGLLAARTPALRGAAAPARGLTLRRVVLGRRYEQATNGTNLGHEER
jgi:tRNA pseudouridine38-40 synthase